MVFIVKLGYLVGSYQVLVEKYQLVLMGVALTLKLFTVQYCGLTTLAVLLVVFIVLSFLMGCCISEQNSLF